MMKVYACLSDRVSPFPERRYSVGGGGQVEPKPRNGFGQDILPNTPLARQARDGGLTWQKTVFEIGGRDGLGAGHVKRVLVRGEADCRTGSNVRGRIQGKRASDKRATNLYTSARVPVGRHSLSRLNPRKIRDPHPVTQA